MKILFFCFLTVIITSMASNINVNAQTIASPLDPGKLALYRDLGIVLGLGSNMQSGTFFPSCNNCEFTDGSKFGYTFGFVFDHQLVGDFLWGVELLFDSKSIESRYLEYEAIEATSTETGNKEMVNILFRHIGEADFLALTAMPFIKWEPMKWAWLRLGVSGAFVLSKNIKHTKELQQSTALLSTDEVVAITMQDENGKNVKSVVVEDAEFQEVNNPIFYLDPAIGFNLKFSERIHLSPIFMYSLPMNNISEKGIDFKISSFRFLLELKFILTSPEINRNNF